MLFLLFVYPHHMLQKIDCLNHNILKNVLVHFVRVRDGKKSSKIKQHAVIYFVLLG